MSVKNGGKKNKNGLSKSIHLRIFIVIIATAVLINAFAFAAGAWFLTHNTMRSIEESMLVAVDLADQYVTKEIEVLKIRAAEAAKDIRLLYNAGEREGALERIGEEYFRYIGLAVFDHNNLLDSWGKSVVPQTLINEPFMRIAMNGGQAVSSTMYSPDGIFVMYVSAPVSDGLVLAAVIPGLHFSGLISKFTFWQSGHLFIDDEKGTVISNIRQQWVETRINFIDLAKTDSSYSGLAEMVLLGQSGMRGVAEFTLNGVPRICAYRPVSSTTENWFLGLIAPIPESPLKDIPSGILLMGMITMVLSLAAAVIASIILRRPYADADHLRRDAEIASLAKSTFLANMSHEIRTPMNGIVGFSELALDGEVSPKTKDYLEKIQINAGWLLEIINDILDISKVESGKMELEKIPFDMHELLSSCRTLILPKAAEKGIILHFYAEPSMNKKPLGDPTRLRQVLINLLSNSVKFTNTGMIKLQAVLKNISDTSITMHFEIKDSGIGMSPEHLLKIFEPFTQAESGTTRKYGGTGLGLTITKNLVNLMGGELQVDSMPGVGTKFSFDLTFDAINDLDDKIRGQNVILDEIEKPSFDGEVLLCEDNAMNQQVICDHLARVGLKTTVADNGKIGVDMVKRRMNYGEKQFDLILMDIHMPVMDGLEASAKIIELKQGIPIIAMTANIMSGDWDIYEKSGMNGCVGKPFTSQELWRCLLKYLSPLGASAANGA